MSEDLVQADSGLAASTSRSPDQFDELIKECGETGWDGDGAPAITEVCAAAARVIASQLNGLKAFPHVAPGLDGTISFEMWGNGKLRKISICAESDGRCRAYVVDQDNHFAKSGRDTPLQIFAWSYDYVEQLLSESGDREVEPTGDAGRLKQITSLPEASS